MKFPSLSKSEPFVEPEPEVPAGWKIEVRSQQLSYAEHWEYRSESPTHLREDGHNAHYYGTGYRSRRAAIVAAIDAAELIERHYRNKNVEWETV